jgi:hypothetical protein
VHERNARKDVKSAIGVVEEIVTEVNNKIVMYYSMRHADFF